VFVYVVCVCGLCACFVWCDFGVGFIVLCGCVVYGVCVVCLRFVCVYMLCQCMRGCVFVFG